MSNKMEAGLLAEARTEVGYADSKASIVLATTGIGFSAFLGGTIASSWRPNELSAAGEALWWIGAVTACTAVMCAGIAVWPRYGKISSTGPVYYWGQAANNSTVAELAKRLDEDKPNQDDRTRNQLFHISKLVLRKYRFVRGSIVLAGASGLFFALAGLTEL